MRIEEGDGAGGRWCEGGGEEGEGCGGDESDDGEAEEAKDGVEGGLVLVAQEPASHDEDECQGEDEHRQGGDDGGGDGDGGGVAFGDGGGVAGIGGGVDAHGAGGDLADGQDVGELLGGEPGMVVDDGVLDEGNHRIASAEGEEADEEEGVEEGEEEHFFSVMS